MEIFDISLTISPSLPVWPGDPRVTLERVSKIEEGNEANVSRMELGVHTGTHVDAPFHYLGNGSTTVEELQLDELIGKAFVLHVPDEVRLITAQVLRQSNLPPGVNRLLIKTSNSSAWVREERDFRENFVAVSPDGADYLVECNVRVIGVDYLSVAPYIDTTPTHVILLEAGVIIIEGLNLSEVPQGEYDLYCLPLKIKGSDGAPARAILVSS